MQYVNQFDSLVVCLHQISENCGPRRLPSSACAPMNPLP